MPYSQENRLIAINTPLGTDALLLQGFTGRETMSRPFSFHLDLLCEPQNMPITFSDIVGQNVTISVQKSDDTKRYFNGLVSRFAQSGADTRFTHFQMEMVPWTWMLTRSADCRIFHNQTVQEIIEAVFSRRGYSDFEFSLTATYPKLEYTVQYRETDFNFISRLMEHNGIFYYFKHEETKHTLMIADDRSAHIPCPGQETAGYNLASGGLDAGDVINSWNIEQELRSGKYALTDYNFITPSTSLGVSETTIVSVGGNSSFELFDYPGDYTVRGDGTALVKLRMQEEEAGYMVANGSGFCRSFCPGYKFTLADHYQDSMNVDYVLTDVQHTASVGGNYTLDGSGPGDTYSNSFVCIPESVPFRPARITPKPFVQGLQTAVVVGKSSEKDSNDDQTVGGDGEEIWVDKWGRVLVLFPWDRQAACSCWVRSSQDWAGQGWGMINIPRVGQEVIVSFIEGDPDRPIITGRVYNGIQKVPYELPANGTRSTFKTHSTTGGGDDNYNELRFEDKKGSEQVFVHAEKDYDTRVKNDSREWIGNNRSLIVKKDQMEKVEGELSLQVAGDRFEKVSKDVHIQVVGNQYEKVTKDLHLNVAGGQFESVTKDVNLKVSGNQNEEITGDMNHHITGNFNHKSDQTVSIQAGMNMYEKSGENYAHEAGMTIHLKAGMTMILEAGMQLSLKVGGSFVDIGPAGVSISGPMVMINSGGAAGSGSGSSPTSPSSATAPTDPKDPTDPDQADDGTKGTKM